jgi:tocopherol O-methyltransferase
LASESTVLDVGCGIGGTTRYLAKTLGCKVIGLTISGRQVELAMKISREDAGSELVKVDAEGFVKLGTGGVRFVELDAEEMEIFFSDSTNKTSFDCVWISEAMSHLPNKELFFQNVSALLNEGGKLVVADWFKAEGLTAVQVEADIKPIEGQALLKTGGTSCADCVWKTECCFLLCAPNPITSTLRNK